MDKLISQQAALDILDEFADKSIEVVGGSYERARKAMCDLASAQPERKTGRWIQCTVGLMVTEYKCSECGRTVRDDTGYDVYKDYPYCHCGAEMQKDGE